MFALSPLPVWYLSLLPSVMLSLWLDIFGYFSGSWSPLIAASIVVFFLDRRCFDARSSWSLSPLYREKKD
jgi:hypothetical protein